MDGLVGVDSFPESAWKPRRNVSTTCPQKNTVPSWDCRSHPSARSHPAAPQRWSAGKQLQNCAKKKKTQNLSQLCPGINPERLRVASTGGLSNALKVVRGGINPCGEADGEALPF